MSMQYCKRHILNWRVGDCLGNDTLFAKVLDGMCVGDVVMFAGMVVVRNH